MADVFSKGKRSEVMRSIRSSGTKPEMLVRRLIHGLGYRYRLHVHSLPGSPDLVFPSRRKVIFVHGCFWHQHTCNDGHMPASRQDYWAPKMTRNKQRDKENRRALRALGWDVLVVWECQVRKAAWLQNRLVRFLMP